MFIDNQITRFQNGVNNLNTGDLFNSLPVPDLSKLHTYFDDFNFYVNADWTTINPGGGAGVAALAANADGGRITITTGNVADEDTGIYKIGRGFQLKFGKKAFMRAIVQVDDAVQSDIILGLQDPTAGDPFDPNDGVWIAKEDNAATWSLFSEKDGNISQSAQFGTTVDDTDTRVGFYWDGISRLWLEVGGAAVGFLDPGANFPDDEVLTPIMYVGNGGLAEARVLQVDYFYAAQER